jgi:putative Mg2+ transporter-C (MgtC) family protein
MFDDLRIALDMQLSIDTIVLRLLAASVLALLIGLEREKKDKPAGLKTHMLVGIGSAAFFLIFIEFALGPLKDAEAISPDPTRVIQGIVTGIGFLGAGAIIQGSDTVRGLTTGAGIWVSGGIGLACGAGYFLIAAVVTLFTLIVLFAVGRIERNYLE